MLTKDLNETLTAFSDRSQYCLNPLGEDKIWGGRYNVMKHEVV